MESVRLLDSVVASGWALSWRMGSLGEYERVRDGLNAAMAGGKRGSDAADRLCAACVDLLDVDFVALSVSYDGAMGRSFGASGELSRELEELQFTFGEGPYLDAIRSGAPVELDDLEESGASRWPAFTDAAMSRGIRSLFAVPISAANVHVGALDLYRTRTGGMEAALLRGALMAAELAALPLLDVMAGDRGMAIMDDSKESWEPAGLARVEVYQAAGMVMAQLGVGSADALVRLRAYAFANDMTASAVGWEIVERRLRLADDATTGTWKDGDW